MEMENVINDIMFSFNNKEIEERLNAIFNGCLGADTGDSPEDMQLNHHLILRIIKLFRAQEHEDTN